MRYTTCTGPQSSIWGEPGATAGQQEGETQMGRTRKTRANLAPLHSPVIASDGKDLPRIMIAASLLPSKAYANFSSS